jgi:uncharacterized protein YndB with AHSA1/START domain
MADPVIVEVTVAAPAQEVWRALRERDQLRRWHGWEYEELEEEIASIFIEDVTESEDRLALDTHGGGRFELEPRGQSTIVRITRAAPAGSEGWDGIYDEINEGWLTFVQQLRFYLERHPGEERRTVLIEREVPLPDGESWFRSEHQAGVLLDDYGLVTTAGGRTIVSAYGLDDSALAQLREGLEGGAS